METYRIDVGTIDIEAEKPEDVFETLGSFFDSFYHSLKPEELKDMILKPRSDEYKIDFNVEPQSCPKCGTKNISADHYEPEGEYRDVECQECGFTWTENLTFVSWEPRD
ncbi:hypothetical protein LCGC14_1522080 [marine sediment metagenome]|uniref:TFIIS-type domain-containing protein n=1 Tax=marine sediment metagenome TaxID=412755 RepID=A0A0F9LZE2_9ZZZZ